MTEVADPAVGLILKRFQQRLDREALRFAGLEANGKATEEEAFVLPLLQDLAKQLSGSARRAGRRTGHAVQRAAEGQRPTTKAWDDALAVPDESILRDDTEATIVVLGPRGRVHVFALDARHVTSLVLAGGSIQKRRQEGRWRPAEPEERGEFRIRLKRRLSRAETDPSSPESTGPPSGSGLAPELG
jgi:hypothetical protein